MDKNQNISVIEGTVSVRAVITANKRKIKNVYVDIRKKEKRDRKTLSFISFLKEKNIPFELVSREIIEKTLKDHSGIYAGNTHGGVIALVYERQYESYEDLLSNFKTGDYFVYLDGVEDPFNLGYSIRTMYAMGCKGFLLSDRSWENAAGVLARSSAGASELAFAAFAPEDEILAEFCKNRGLPIVCSALSKNSQPLSSFSPDKPFLLVIGGEKRGISPVFMDNAEKIIHIPYQRTDVKYSLPTASVCAMYANALENYVSSNNKGEDKCSDM